MWNPPKKRKKNSMNIGQTTSGQYIPARKANRSSPIPFASCAIFWNVTILLNPSIAKEILKSQRSNAPSVASWGWRSFIKLENGGRIPLNSAMNKTWRNTARGNPDRDNSMEAITNRVMKAVAAPRPSANASEFFALRYKRYSSARLTEPQGPKKIRATSPF